MLKVQQVLPARKLTRIRGLYLGERLMEMSNGLGRSVVLADFLTDKNGVVATADKPGEFHIPAEMKNSSDWGLFQELMAQADVIIIGGTHLKSLATAGNTAQDILYQFESGKGFDELGGWRLGAGYRQRSPDLAIVSRDLDFELPEALTGSARKIAIFTTDAMASSDNGQALKKRGAIMIGGPDAGVDGGTMIAALSDDMGYRVIMMAGGPGVLEVLLAAKCLDLLYITEAQLEIPLDDPSTGLTILSGGRRVNELQEFSLSRELVQENVVTEDASHITQLLLRYDRKDIRG